MTLKSYQWLDIIVEERGAPVGTGPVPAAEAERYRGRIPDNLVDFWIRHGRGSWINGLVWLCDPGQLQPFVETVFRGDPEFDPDVMVPYLRDAFGHVTCWHPTRKVVNIDSNLGLVSSTDITRKLKDGKPQYDDEDALDSSVSVKVEDIRGWVDAETGEPVFAGLLERLGPITEDQVYTMAPHYRLGGPGTADTFSIGGLVEYLGFLAQIGPFTLDRFVDPKESGRGGFGHMETVRPIGPQPSGE